MPEAKSKTGTRDAGQENPERDRDPANDPVADRSQPTRTGEASKDENRAPSGPKVGGAVAEKLNELRANAEASQTQASLGDHEGGPARPRSASHTLPEEDVHVLGGYPVPAGAEHDTTVENETVFYDGPSMDANQINPKDGEAAEGEVWKAVYQNNAKLPTFVLVANRGQLVNLDQQRGDLNWSDF